MGGSACAHHVVHGMSHRAARGSRLGIKHSTRARSNSCHRSGPTNGLADRLGHSPSACTANSSAVAKRRPVCALRTVAQALAGPQNVHFAPLSLARDAIVNQHQPGAAEQGSFHVRRMRREHRTPCAFAAFPLQAQLGDMPIGGSPSIPAKRHRARAGGCRNPTCRPSGWNSPVKHNSLPLLCDSV